MKKCCWATVLVLLVAASGRCYTLDVERYGALGEEERFDFDRAEAELKKGRWLAAKNEYGKFLKLYPKSVAAPYVQLMIGYCLQRDNQVHTAIKEYKSVRDYFPGSPEAPIALSWIASAYDAIGQPEDAIKFWSMIPKEYEGKPICIPAIWRIGQFHIERKLPATAAEQYTMMIEKYPSFDPHHEYGAWYRAGEWLVRYHAIDCDDPDKAIAAYTKFRAKYLREHHRQAEPEAVRNAAKEAVTYVAGIYRASGNASLGQNKLSEASKYFDRAVALYEKAGNLYEQAGINREFARQCKALGYLSAAKKYYDNAVELYTKGGFLLEVAWFNREVGRHQDAVDALLLYLAKHEEDDGTRVAFGRYLEELGKWEDARDQYLKMKNKVAGLVETAESFVRQRKFKEAIDTFKKISDENMDRYSWALFRMGECYADGLGDPEKAIRCFKESMYGETAYLYWIAECLRRLKKYEQALDQLKEILQWFPNQAPQAYWRMVPILHERNGPKDMEKCIAVCRRICRAFPASGESSAAHQHLENAHKITVTEGGEKGKSEEEVILGF